MNFCKDCKYFREEALAGSHVVRWQLHDRCEHEESRSSVYGDYRAAGLMRMPAWPCYDGRLWEAKPVEGPTHMWTSQTGWLPE